MSTEGRMDTLLEALNSWRLGYEVDQQAVMFGLRLIWWGRIGKALTFLAGATIVLDIIGPERIAEWSRSRIRIAPRTSRMVKYSFGMAVAGVAILTLVTPVIWVNYLIALGLVLFVGMIAAPLEFFSNVIARTVSGIFRRGALAEALRICAAFILVIGFALDMLTS
jgi:hypothetical protein